MLNFVSQNSSLRGVTLVPLAWAAAFFALGIFAGSQITLSVLTVILATALLLVIVIKLLTKKSLTATAIMLAFFMAGAFSYMAETLTISADRLKVIYETGGLRSGEMVEIEGTIVSGPELSVTGAYAVIETDAAVAESVRRKVSGRVRLFLTARTEADQQVYRALDLKSGDRIVARTPLKREDRYLNPGVRRATENLDRQGLDAAGTVDDPANLMKISSAAVTVNPLSGMRQWLLREFRRNFSVATAGVLAASLLGNKYHLDKPTAEAFREGGTFHMLVISGAHITLIGAAMVWALSLVTRRRLVLFAVSNAFLWAFALAVGGEAPVMRAVIMFSVISFAHVARRQATLLNALGASALLLLVWRPSELFDPSFQLTFVCVFAIVGVAMPLWQKLERTGTWHPSSAEPLPPNVSPQLRAFCEALFWNERRWQREQKRTVWHCRLFKSDWARLPGVSGAQTAARYLFGALLVSLIVQLFALPLTIVYFHRVTPAGIALNLFAGGLLAAETLCGVFAVLLTQISQTAAAPFIWLAESFNGMLLLSPPPGTINAGFPAASWRLPAYTGAGVAVYALYFLPLIFLWRRLDGWNPFALRRDAAAARRASAAAAMLVVLVGVAVFHPLAGPPADGNLRIDFLDVGQGDAALLTFPDGRTMLIDGGGRFNFDRTKVTNRFGVREEFAPDVPSIGESVVSAFLWQRGLSRIDYVLATHADIDHIQGLNDVAKNFEIGTALIGLTGEGQPPPANLNEFLATLAGRGVPVRWVAGTDRLQIGGAEVEILSPPVPTTGDAPWKKENNNSVVARVAFGERVFLFTGDIEQEAESRLLADDGERLRCDVVKVPHHGSRTSSTAEFVAATGARTAIISVGRDSPFGHPHRDVIERWAGSGAEIMTTGAHGTVTIVTDGSELEISTFLPPR